MTVRTLERSRLEPILFPISRLPMNGCAIPAGDASAANMLAFRRTKARRGQAAPSTAGCLRGFFWAVAFECTVAFCAYEGWHLWRFLR
jgi:hypothetical protein